MKLYQPITFQNSDKITYVFLIVKIILRMKIYIHFYGCRVKLQCTFTAKPHESKIVTWLLNY